MFGKQDLIDAMALECDVAKHLFAKLPREDWAATLAWRPSPAQRSTEELLRFLSYCGIGACLACVEGTWDGWKRVAQRGEEMGVDDFAAAMDRQKEEITSLLGDLAEEDFSHRTAKNPLGHELSLGRALMDMPQRWLVGYRMQMFLYARALGAEVATPDCWYGFSNEKPK
jgi:hypothetical protein